jgi:hypothetical protein
VYARGETTRSCRKKHQKQRGTSILGAHTKLGIIWFPPAGVENFHDTSSIRQITQNNIISVA